MAEATKQAESADNMESILKGIREFCFYTVGSAKATTEECRRYFAFKAGAYYAAILPWSYAMSPEQAALMALVCDIPPTVMEFLLVRGVTEDIHKKFVEDSVRCFLTALENISKEPQYQGQVFDFDTMTWKKVS